MVINTFYQDKSNIKDIKLSYNKNYPNSIMLKEFFQVPIVKLLSGKLNSSVYKLEFDPYKYKYFSTVSKAVDSFIYGIYFDNIIKNVLSIKNFKINYNITKLEHGCFTLLHDSENISHGVDFFFDFSYSNIRNGGFIRYQDDKSEILELKTLPNSLSFVNRSNKILRYIKYVSHKQDDPIILVIGSLIKNK